MKLADVRRLAAEYEGPGKIKQGVADRILLVDGDGYCYNAAYQGYVTLKPAIRYVHQRILEDLYLSQSCFARVHLTARDCYKAGRGSIRAYKPYQGNRKGKPKPPMLEPLREALMTSQGHLDEAEFILNKDWEADDGLIMDQVRLGDQAVIASPDKDLRQCRGRYFDHETITVDDGGIPGRLWLHESERTGARTLKGRGMLFFWAQMLMGDQADNIQGLAPEEGKKASVGPVKAFELLDGKTELEAAELVLNLYKDRNQNPIPEGWLLYLLRHPDDNVLEYLNELDLSPGIKQYLGDCRTRDWYEGA